MRIQIYSRYVRTHTIILQKCRILIESISHRARASPYRCLIIFISDIPLSICSVISFRPTHFVIYFYITRDLSLVVEYIFFSASERKDFRAIRCFEYFLSSVLFSFLEGLLASLLRNSCYNLLLSSSNYINISL